MTFRSKFKINKKTVINCLVYWINKNKSKYIIGKPVTEVLEDLNRPSSSSSSH